LRSAAGANSQVLRLVIGEGMLLALIGFGGWAWPARNFVGRLMKTVLVSSNAIDPAAICSRHAVLLLSALLACYIPGARHPVDPNGRLRDE